MFLVLLCWCIISECTSALTRAAYVDAQLTLLSSGASPQWSSLPQEFHQRCKQLDESLFVSPDYHVCPSAIMDCVTTLDGLWQDLMQFDLLCTDTKLSLTRPLDPLSLIEMRAWLTFSPTFSLPKERERGDLWPIPARSPAGAAELYQPHQQQQGFRPQYLSIHPMLRRAS